MSALIKTGFRQAGAGAIPRALQDKARERVSVEDFGANAGATSAANAAALQAAITNAKANSIKYLEVSSAITADDTVTGKGSVIFVGAGSIAGLYRKRVAKPTDPTTAAFCDLGPEQHMRRFLSKQNPVVVIVGDSTSTDVADTMGRTESIWSLVREKLSQAYPDKTITFYNRGIGGETYFTAVGLPSSFPAWYTDHAKAWPTYIGALNPDLVIFNFGMNDENSFQSSTIANYEGLLDNASIFPAGRPDLIFCTNHNPALDSTLAGFGTKAAQAGRDFVAGYTRSYARSKGYGLLDFHRMATIVRDGYDPTATSMRSVGAVIPQSGTVTAPLECTDFKWDLTVSGLTSAQPMAVKLAAEEVTDNAGRGAFAVLSVNGGGYLTVDLYDRPGNIYAGLVSTVAVPAGAFGLVIEKKQQTLLVLVNGVEAIAYNKLRVHGKDFLPRVGDATYQTGTITAANFYAGDYKTFRPSMVNDELYGASSASTATKQPNGGNGVNHLSSLGIAAIVKPVIDMAAWSARVPTLESINVTFKNGWTQLGGFSQSRAMRVNNMVTVEVHIVPPAANATGIAFTLPANFCPPAAISVFVDLATATETIRARAQIGPNGDFNIINGGANWLFGTVTYSAAP